MKQNKKNTKETQRPLNISLIKNRRSRLMNSRHTLAPSLSGTGRITWNEKEGGVGSGWVQRQYWREVPGLLFNS